MMINDTLDSDSVGCGFNAFKESEEITALIEQLKDPSLSLSLVEKNTEKFKSILSQYQDQPHLLDPFLEGILGPIISLIKDENVNDSMKHNAFKYLFILMNVKTYKKLVTYLPHEVMDFLPVLRMLEKQDPTDLNTWETRYVLLIWLSIISKIPFPLSRLEISDNIEPSQTIVGRILEICKKYCLAKDSCPVAAVFLVANFLTRSDVKKLYLEEMIMWCLKCLEDDPLSHGPLAVLASILKHSSREDLKPYCQTLFDKISTLNLFESPNALIRKFATKVVQRIGFVLLRPKLATWRYQKSGTKNSLLLNINDLVIENVEDTKTTAIIDNEDQDVPPLIEEIIEQLIQGLRDKTIDIRWSAAKGIGRITARLPVDLADEVVGFVLNLFSGRELESAWHGGCLALAELGRRGLLLPHRLDEVIPLVSKALVFDEPRAYGSVGSTIRDAACYVCWSFARAFEPEILQPHVQQIAATLLIVACFDREINCRRAASAAFQENVGRQGNFPHGIDIVTIADYFEVGVRSHAYLKISVHIAQYKEYIIPMIDHLVQRKISHWDTAIRELAAKALRNLTPFDPDYIIQVVIPILIEYTSSIDLNTRHGTVLAIAEILEALHLHFNDKIENILGALEVENIKKIISLFKARGQMKGLGGELMKQACSVLIEKCALVHFPVHTSAVLHDWQNLLEDCLKYEVAIIRLKAAEAHTAFFTEYYANISKEKRYAITDRYLENLKASCEITRIGFAQAIGYFPTFMLRERIEDIVKGLISCCRITDATDCWAESRRKALQSLTMSIQNLGMRDIDAWQPFIHEVYDCYLLALKEYTIDSRGDIGAWVREAAMAGLHFVTNLVSQAQLFTLLDESIVSRIIGGVAQQAVERIDRTRVQAGKVFCGLLYCDPELPNIPYHDELKRIFPYEVCRDEINWMMELETFPRFIKMLDFPPYIDNVLRGIIFSVGGLSESLVKHSSMSLFSYLNEVDEDHFKTLCDKMLDIFDESHGDERMIPSILVFLDRLLSSGCLQKVLDDPYNLIPERMFLLVKREKQSTTNSKLILNIITVFCQLLQAKGSVSKQAFTQLSILLCNKFQAIRRTTALRLYEALTLYEGDLEISEEHVADMLSILNSTDWGKSPNELRPIRNRLCEIMGVPSPVTMKKPKD
ncbi:tubulin-specific chaperone D [Chelonus insularis]|uniref:tubulin-specific chaperone D n=1 Tax=Chelonus insularis TaxID=460826 RepID=UPI00158C68FD|nr:tubulin-specific chaperone D [Chelonus insularis]